MPHVVGRRIANGLVDEKQIGIAVCLAKLGIERDDAIEILADDIEAPVLFAVDAVRKSPYWCTKVGERRPVTERQLDESLG